MRLEAIRGSIAPAVCTTTLTANKSVGRCKADQSAGRLTLAANDSLLHGRLIEEIGLNDVNPKI